MKVTCAEPCDKSRLTFDAGRFEVLSWSLPGFQWLVLLESAGARLSDASKSASAALLSPGSSYPRLPTPSIHCSAPQDDQTRRGKAF